MGSGDRTLPLTSAGSDPVGRRGAARGRTQPDAPGHDPAPSPHGPRHRQSEPDLRRGLGPGGPHRQRSAGARGPAGRPRRERGGQRPGRGGPVPRCRDRRCGPCPSLRAQRPPGAPADGRADADTGVGRRRDPRRRGQGSRGPHRGRGRPGARVRAGRGLRGVAGGAVRRRSGDPGRGRRLVRHPALRGHHRAAQGRRLHPARLARELPQLVLPPAEPADPQRRRARRADLPRVRLPVPAGLAARQRQPALRGVRARQGAGDDGASPRHAHVRAAVDGADAHRRSLAVRTGPRGAGVPAGRRGADHGRHRAGRTGRRSATSCTRCSARPRPSR